MSENPRLEKWKRLYEETSYEKTEANAPPSPTVTNYDLVKRSPQSTVHTIHYVPVDSPVVYVGFWRRLFAFFIDGIITSVFSLFTDNYLIISILGLLYYSLLTSSSLQGTLGKAAIGAIVVDKSGNRISFARAIGRYFSYIISTILLLIGFIMIAFHGEKRGLHDLICGTKVINRRK